jgi:hypothetical protein
MSTRVQKPLLVRGTVVLPAGIAMKGAQARIQLLDVSFQDVAGKVLAETLISNVTDDEPTEFDLRGDVPAANGYYTVAVLVKPGRNSSPVADWDAIERGDLFNTQSYPVTLSADAPASVDVAVKLYAGSAEPQARSCAKDGGCQCVVTVTPCPCGPCAC